MHVFVTGASGFVGSAVVEDLLRAGHRVTGLARSDAAAEALERAGVAVHRGSLEDLDSLRAGARSADAVAHLAFSHDFSKFVENGVAERAAIDALGEALEGTRKPLVVTSGVALVGPGHLVTEDESRDPKAEAFPRDPETVAAKWAARGVPVSVIRLAPSTHDLGDKGFVPMFAAAARQHGRAGYVGDGANRWPGVHRRDAARLYRLAIERGTAHAVYHAIGDEGVPTRSIAEAVGRNLHLPVVSLSPDEAAAHFGWFLMFAGIDCPASSAKTQATLGWKPEHPGLLADIDREAYFGDLVSA